MRSWLAVGAATVLLVSGCAPAAAPEGLSGDQLDQWTAINRDALWLNTGLPASERPEVSVLQFVSRSDLNAYYTQCMDELGPSGLGFNASGDGFTIEDDTDRDELAIVNYRCLSYYVIDPLDQGYYSTAQLDATYDYFAQWLVPCLAGEGYAIDSAPSRVSIASNPGYLIWNPYQEIPPIAVTQELFAKCAPFPSYLNIDYF